MFRAIGFVIVLLAVRFLMPVAFHSAEDTLVQVFGALQSAVAEVSQNNLLASPSGGLASPTVSR